MMNHAFYNLLAESISYPAEGYFAVLKKLSSSAKTQYPEFSNLLETFFDEVSTLDFSTLEEYYLQTFLLQPVSSLDIGFVLFGNDSKRNEFLVHMHAEQNKANNETGIELADHLPNVLTLLTKINGQDIADELVYSILIPAMIEISRRFDETENIYRYLIGFIAKVLQHDFQGFEYEQFVINKNIKF